MVPFRTRPSPDWSQNQSRRTVRPVESGAEPDARRTAGHAGYDHEKASRGPGTQTASPVRSARPIRQHCRPDARPERCCLGGRPNSGRDLHRLELGRDGGLTPGPVSRQPSAVRRGHTPVEFARESTPDGQMHAGPFPASLRKDPVRTSGMLLQ